LQQPKDSGRLLLECFEALQGLAGETLPHPNAPGQRLKPIGRESGRTIG
jgi:hypothetical protein